MSNCDYFDYRNREVHDKILLLDVGSCFHPFAKFEEFIAIGIDISPAIPVSHLYWSLKI